MRRQTEAPQTFQQAGASALLGSAIANPVSSATAYAKALADPSRPLLPRATRGLYVPGSIFKIVTATAENARSAFPGLRQRAG